MLKIDTSKPLAEIQANGDPIEIGKEIVTIASTIATAIAKDGNLGKIKAMLMLKMIGMVFSDDDYIADIVDGALGDAIVSTEPLEGETEEETRARANLMAIQKYTKARPIKVDGDYNRIEDESEDDEE